MSNGADIYTTTIYDFSFNHSSIEEESILSIMSYVTIHLRLI